jgi:hypothetical protein
MNRNRQLIKFGSQEIAIPSVMIAYDGKGNQQLIKTTTPKHRLKVFRGKTALNLVDSNTPTRVEKISRTAVIETAEIKKPRRSKKDIIAKRERAERNATTIQSAFRNKIARNKVRREVANQSFNVNRNQSIQNMQRDIMVGGILNDIIYNVPIVSQIKNERNILPNPLLVEAQRPKIEVKPKETPKIKQQIVAKQAAIATTSTFDATRTYTREQLDAMSSSELSELLRSIMGSNLAPKKGKDPQVATDVYNAYQRNLTRKGRELINKRTQQPSKFAPGPTTANMIFSRITAAEQIAAGKIQGALKKLKDKKKDKQDLIRRLSREQLRRLEGAQSYKDRLIIEQEKLSRYTDNPRKFALMQKQIEKTNKQIEFYMKQANFIRDKIAKL